MGIVPWHTFELDFFFCYNLEYITLWKLLKWFLLLQQEKSLPNVYTLTDGVSASRLGFGKDNPLSRLLFL